MRRLFEQARIVNPGSDPAYLEEGWILVEDGIIQSLGPAPAPDTPPAESVDLKGGLVLPGMINAHTHLYSALARGMPPPARSPADFLEILQQIWWKLDRSLDADLLRASFEVGLLECLRAGVTTIFDHHSSPEYTRRSLSLLVDLAAEFGLNISPAFEITDRNGPERFEWGLEENLRVMEAYAGNPQIRPLCGLHASLTLSDDSLRRIRRGLENFDTWGIHIHVSEDRADEDDARKKGYPSVVKRLRHFDLINARSLLAHGLFLDAGDCRHIAEVGAGLIHNPTSNANNRVGLLAEDIIQQCRAGLGTDGMQADLLREAREGSLIRSSHTPPAAREVAYLDLLFVRNPEIATALFGHPLGRIAPGYQADLAVYDHAPGTELNPENLTSQLLYGLPPPRAVITRGEFRLRDGQLVQGSEQEIRERAVAGSRKLWNAMHNL